MGLLREGLPLLLFPDAVVLADVERGEAEAAGLAEEIEGLEFAVGRAAHRVQVAVEDGAVPERERRRQVGGIADRGHGGSLGLGQIGQEPAERSDAQQGQDG